MAYSILNPVWKG